MTTPTPTPTVTVNGLQMPTTMYPRVIAAMRGTYPTLTAGLSDEAAIQAVMRNAVVAWLAAWEGLQAGDPTTAAEAARAAAQSAQQAAAAQAVTDAAAIQVTTTT